MPNPESWGSFLRYNYLKFDFTSIRKEGLYFVKYGNQQSQPFRIAGDVFSGTYGSPSSNISCPFRCAI